MRTPSIVAIGTALVVLAACSTPMPPDAASAPTPASTTRPSPAAAQPAAPSAAAVSPSVSASALAPHLDPRSEISAARSVYFDYEVFSIKREYVSVVERHGRYLLAHPTLTIRIEGHADERGSAEYNLALGQKRAQAVAHALLLIGVPESQMEAVSWGEERPRSSEHDERAWAENRRADIVYPRR